MFNLAQYIQQTHREKKQQAIERNQLEPTERLNPLPEPDFSSHSDEILQPSVQNNVRSIIDHLSDVTQSYDGQGNTQQVNSSDNENNINLSAALLSFFLYITAIALVIFGALHLKDCPAENMITISYIVMGCLMLVSRILSCPEECRDIFNKGNNFALVPKTLCRMGISFVIQIAIICFFFAVCYWIFKIHPDTEESSPNYCEKNFYRNTYYGCIVGTVFLVIFIIGLIGFIVFRRSRSKF